MLPLLAYFTSGGEVVAAAVHTLFPHTIGVLAGLFGFTTVAVGVAEANNSTAESAANVGGAGAPGGAASRRERLTSPASGLGYMDEQKLREREALEDAQLAEDKKKAAGKLAAGRGLLDPTNKSLADVVNDVTKALS